MGFDQKEADRYERSCNSKRYGLHKTDEQMDALWRRDMIRDQAKSIAKSQREIERNAKARERELARNLREANKREKKREKERNRERDKERERHALRMATDEKYRHSYEASQIKEAKEVVILFVIGVIVLFVTLIATGSLGIFISILSAIIWCIKLFFSIIWWLILQLV